MSLSMAQTPIAQRPEVNTSRYHHLDLYVLPGAEEDDDTQSHLEDLHAKYVAHANKHNESNRTRAPHEDSGFDLLAPRDYDLTEINRTTSVLRLDHQVAAVMRAPPDHQRTTGYYIYPRSSLSKTPLRLANSVGIIDAGYRGPLIAALDILHVNHSVRKGDRLVQVCAPDLSPINVGIRPLGELPPDTERGSRGFGTAHP
jgi:dUTP pyrophosphatase